MAWLCGFTTHYEKTEQTKVPIRNEQAAGSSPITSSTSRQAFWLVVFLCNKNTPALCLLPLLFRKKARLLRLCLCERRHNASAELPPFCDNA